MPFQMRRGGFIAMGAKSAKFGSTNVFRHATTTGSFTVGKSDPGRDAPGFVLMDRTLAGTSSSQQLRSHYPRSACYHGRRSRRDVNVAASSLLDVEAIELGRRLLVQSIARLIWTTPEDVQKAWILFQYRDKTWSFVDCVSFAIAQRLEIRNAFAFDEHFRQIGTLTVHPD